MSLKTEFSKCFVKSNLVILCPLYPAGEKKDLRFDQFKFAKLIGKNSKTQVIVVQNKEELINYFRKNLTEEEIIIGMGAGAISKWIATLKNSL